MIRLLLCGLFVPLMVTSTLRAQGALPLEEALAYTRYYWHGPASISDAERHRVLSDPGTIEFFGRLIDGTVAWPRGSDTATVLFWLVESGDRRFVPTFLRFARPPQARHQGNMFITSVAGLARHADVPQAAARLRALIVDPNERDVAFQVASVLATFNDEPARLVLSELSLAQLSESVRSVVTRALATSPLPRGSRSAFPHRRERTP